MAKGSSGGFGQQIDIRVAAGVIALAIAVFGGGYYLLTRPEKSIVIPPTPEQVTVSVLNQTVERVGQVLSSSPRAPRNMSELPALEDGSSPNADGWSNELVLKITGGGARYIVEVRSKGPDAVAGNSDDIVVEATLTREPGSTRYFVSAQTQQGGMPPTPEGEG